MKRSQRILMVSEYFHPHWTGLAKSFLNLAQSLLAEGHRVTVITSRFKEELPARDNYQGLEIIRSRCLFHLSRTHYSFHILVDFLKKKKDADLVIVNSPFSNILPVAVLAKLSGKRLLIYHQGDLKLPRLTGSKATRWLVEQAFYLCTIPAMALADSLSTYTADYARHSRAMRYFQRKFRPVIPPLKIPDMEPDQSLLAKLNLLKRKYRLVGFAGRFVEEKGFDVLLHAVPFVKERLPDVKFVFAGDVNVSYESFFDYNQELLQRFSSDIEILGLLEENGLEAFYRSLDLFVLCSRSDCFALTQVEAALRGVPLVVSDIPGARMLVKETGAGYLVSPEDPQALARGIVQAIEAREVLIRQLPKVNEFLKRYEKLQLD